jgi:methylase of polypeptide subunit release factors
MSKTITGKETEILNLEIKNLFQSYLSKEKDLLETEHKNKDNSFSKIIMIYKNKLDFIDGSNFETKKLDFYSNYMSIKVIELIYRTWKNPEEKDYIHEGMEEIEVLPGVFSPNFASDSYIWAKYMVDKGIIEGKDVLEMGAGSGVISLYLYKYGNPKSVTAVDINKQAIKNLNLNAEKFGVKENFKIIESDLYKNVSENKFDIIFWAYVWLKIEDSEIKRIIENEEDKYIKNLLLSVTDSNYEMLDKFITESKKYLKEGGSILLITSDFLPNEDIKKIAEKNDFEFGIEKFTEQEDVVKSAEMVLDLYNITLKRQQCPKRPY